jgi:transmembrane sensor
MPDQPHAIPEEVQEAAATWLARRDRGLTAAEQDGYLEWLYANPVHGRAIVRVEQAWTALSKLEQWRPTHSAAPNPDLLVPRRPARIYWLSAVLASAAAAAAVMVAWFVARPSPVPVAPREAIVHPGPERRALADGSIVELNEGARFEVQFTANERRVRLLAGEAHFAVAHNAARPFFVDTDRGSVRAVGTAFDVALATHSLAVLVTEGRVQVTSENRGQNTEDRKRTTEDGFQSSSSVPSHPSSEIYLSASQRTVLDADAGTTPTVEDLTAAEIERALSWRAMRLEFVDMPLRDVVAAFNRYNQRQLSVADEATGDIRVGGTFRADNIDAFIRLLDESFGVSGFRVGDQVTLRKTR